MSRHSSERRLRWLVWLEQLRLWRHWRNAIAQLQQSSTNQRRSDVRWAESWWRHRNALVHDHRGDVQLGRRWRQLGSAWVNVNVAYVYCGLFQCLTVLKCPYMRNRLTDSCLYILSGVCSGKLWYVLVATYVLQVLVTKSFTCRTIWRSPPLNDYHVKSHELPVYKTLLSNICIFTVISLLDIVILRCNA